MKKFLFALMGIIISLPSWGIEDICEYATIKQLIEKYGNGNLEDLKDVCENNSYNVDVISVIADLVYYDNEIDDLLVNFYDAYNPYAELLEDTEDLRSDTSVWRTADGKFNTARLASDSIAGVVLGTVGGVVTSTIMKKSQIRNGLEYIKCVVGGQTVASYDDQFSVGLK